MDTYDVTILADSMLSNLARGRPPRLIESDHPELHAGISAYLTALAASNQAQRWPKLGRFVAEMRVTSATGCEVNCWGENEHLTIWGDPLKLADAVTDILSVETL